MCPVVLNETIRPTGELPLDLFYSLIREIGETVLAIFFWNYGEPFINKDLQKMFRAAKEKGIITVVSTNFSLFNESMLRGLIVNGLDYIIVSINGATQQTYEQYTGVHADFKKITSNLRALMRLKKELHSRTPFVNLQYIVMKDNEKEINQIKKLSKNIGVDRLTLKSFLFDRKSEKNLDFIPSNKRTLMYSQNPGLCNRPWLSSVVLWNGMVVPCCADIEFAWVVGNLQDRSFRNIWNGMKYQAFRKNLVSHSRDICFSDCPIAGLISTSFLSRLPPDSG
jgi:radical SAM protein with 4Fe4S-binding SPASM domain